MAKAFKVRAFHSESRNYSHIFLLARCAAWCLDVIENHFPQLLPFGYNIWLTNAEGE